MPVNTMFNLYKYDNTIAHENVLVKADFLSDDGYVKMPDGTMLCWGSTTINFTDPAPWGNVFYKSWYGTLSFPMMFTEIPKVFLSCKDMNVISVVTSEVEKGAIKNLMGVFAQSVTRTSEVSYLAIGRWK